MEISKEDLNDFQSEMRSFRDDVKAGFGTMIQLAGETNARLDQTNARLDDFRHEVNERLDGISNFLLSSEISRQAMDQRVTRLEQRLDRLEKQGPAA